MTDLAWIAAVLNPRDLAPHQNFWSTESFTPPALMALVASGRLEDLLQRKEARDALEGPERQVLSRPVIAAADAFALGTVESGANQLVNLVLSGNLSDVACIAACSLMAAVALGELDEFGQLTVVLDRALEDIDGLDANDTQRLLRAVILQQMAFRRSDQGFDGSEQAREVLQLLDSIDVSILPRFIVSQSVAWDSVETMRLIVEHLREAALLQLEASDGFSPGALWLARVKRAPSVLSLKSSRNAASGYGSYLAESFDSLVGSRSGKIGGWSEGGDRDLNAALLSAELTGHRLAQFRRSELGILRYVRGPESDSVVLMRQEALRLLRQSADKKRLQAALRQTTSGGPLESLRRDCLQIIERRARHAALKSADFLVLDSAATLLSTNEAVSALEIVFASIRDGIPIESGRWEADSIKLENAWKAAAALSSVAGSSPEASERLLRSVQNTATADELLDIGYARAVANFDWLSITADDVANAWHNWLGSETAVLFPRLSEAVSDHLGQESGIDEPAVVPNLATIARLLNDSILHGREISSATLQSASRTVADSMSRIRADSAGGLFSGGGLTVSDVAIGLAMYQGQDQLWPEIASFLSDTSVQRSDSAAAFERMAREPEKVPPLVLNRLKKNWIEVLNSPPQFLGSSVSPFPAALRGMAALGILTSDQVLAETVRLAGQSLSLPRLEAAKTVSVMARRPAPASWVIAVALQLSRDAEAGVRAEGARAISILLPRSPAQTDLLTDRLLELLREDGLLVPLLILRGLAESKLPLNDKVLLEVRRLSQQHLATAIRRQASELVEQQDES